MELTLKTLQSEKNMKGKEILKQKDELDSFIADLLQQEGIEADKKRDLEKAISEVDEQEAAVAKSSVGDEDTRKTLASFECSERY